MQRLLFAAAILLSALASPVIGRAEEPIVLRFAHVVSEKAPKGIGANLLKERVEAAFPGRVRVDVFPRSQRFTDEEVLLALILGDVELAAPSFTLFQRYSPATQVFELPFLFKNVEHVHRFQQTEIGRGLLDSMQGRGLKGLAYWDSGMRVIGADRPLHMPEDAHGMTFRIENSAIFQEQYDNIDVVAIQMPFGQIHHALKRGLINGLENSWSNIYTFGMFPLVRNFTQTNHSFLGYMLVTSQAFWDGLPSDVRAGLERIIAEISAEERRIAAEQEVNDRKTIAASADARIIELTGTQLEAWRAAFLPAWEPFRARIGEDVIAAAVAAGTDR